ncbi:cytochrome C and Quinol oxidase polypeptide I [archaeon BMS3Bbin15]|nr:cytochrome C and Quinol oxidase polypeptide I [archaeon BMS3Bbin15]
MLTNAYSRISMNLPLRFLGVSLIYLIAGEFLGVLSISGHSYGFAHAHILLVGFVVSVIMGTIYQQIPTLSGTQLNSKKLAEASFWLLNSGLIIFVLGHGKHWISVSGAFLLLIAFYLFYVVVLLTLKNRKADSYIFKYYLTSSLFLSLSATLGFLMLFFPDKKLMFAHTHIALLLGVTLLIIGAMSWMLPMVVLRQIHSEIWMDYVFMLLTVGSAFLIIANIAGKYYLQIAGSVLIIVAVLLFTANMFLTYFNNKRAKSVEAKFFISAIFYLLLTLIAGVLAILNWNIKLLHVHLALLGFVTQTIFGGLYHVIPMLCYVELLPKMKDKTPPLRELFSDKVSWEVFILFNAGILLLLSGFLTDFKYLKMSGGLTIILSTLIFTFEMFKIIRRVL